MAKKEKPAEVKEPKSGKPKDYAEVNAKNKGIDMFARGAGQFIHLPHGTADVFIAKAEYFDVPSRLGEGPCVCMKKFMLPNGDFISPGQTFDPLVERMSVPEFGSLKDRKYFDVADNEIEHKLILKAEKTK